MIADGREAAAGAGPLRVLVVDDEDVMRKAWTRILRPPEFEVRAAARAEQALAELERGPFDAVVLDIVMPGMSGLDALPMIKLRWPGVEVLMTTAHAGLDAAAQAVGLGACAFITKPFESIDAVAEAVRAAARRAVLRARPG
jgi:DNA-binding NtrC family response regulator